MVAGGGGGRIEETMNTKRMEDGASTATTSDPGKGLRGAPAKVAEDSCLAGGKMGVVGTEDRHAPVPNCYSESSAVGRGRDRKRDPKGKGDRERGREERPIQGVGKGEGVGPDSKNQHSGTFTDNNYKYEQITRKQKEKEKETIPVGR